MKCVMMRATGLNNVRGRVAYIDNETGKQEHLLYSENTLPDEIDQNYYLNRLRKHREKTAKSCNNDTKSKNLKLTAGREFMMAIDNSIPHETEEDLKKIAKKAERIAKEETGQDIMFVAIHLNKKENNLHIHIIVPEYQIKKDLDNVVSSTTYRQNTWYDQNGKRSSKKICVDENGKLKKGCTFYKKGQTVYKADIFGGKKLQLKDKKIAQNIKKDLAKWLNREVGFEKYTDKKDKDKLATQHVGKDKPKELRGKIEQKNKIVEEYNKSVDERKALVSEIESTKNLISFSENEMNLLDDTIEDREFLKMNLNLSDIFLGQRTEKNNLDFRNWEENVKELTTARKEKTEEFSKKYEEKKEKKFVEIHNQTQIMFNDLNRNRKRIDRCRVEINDRENTPDERKSFRSMLLELKQSLKTLPKKISRNIKNMRILSPEKTENGIERNHSNQIIGLKKLPNEKNIQNLELSICSDSNEKSRINFKYSLDKPRKQREKMPDVFYVNMNQVNYDFDKSNQGKSKIPDRKNTNWKDKGDDFGLGF